MRFHRLPSSHPSRGFARRRAALPTASFLSLLVMAVAFLATPAVSGAAESGTDEGTPRAETSAQGGADFPPVRRLPQPSPAQLWAAVERAWNAGDAAGIASLCDSGSVHISLKPGGAPASAPTLNGVAFLIHDQLDLVSIRGFRVVRFDADLKRRKCRAWARWIGDWGEGKGVRDLEVTLAARAVSEGQWLLTEIRAGD